jgi:hypothetical protein
MKLSAAQRKLKTEKLVKKRNAYTLSVYVAEIGAIPLTGHPPELQDHTCQEDKIRISSGAAGSHLPGR